MAVSGDSRTLRAGVVHFVAETVRARTQWLSRLRTCGGSGLNSIMACAAALVPVAARAAFVGVGTAAGTGAEPVRQQLGVCTRLAGVCSERVAAQLAQQVLPQTGAGGQKQQRPEAQLSCEGGPCGSIFRFLVGRCSCSTSAQPVLALNVGGVVFLEK